MAKSKPPPIAPTPSPDDGPAHMLCGACDGAGAGYEGAHCDKCGAKIPERPTPRR